MPLSVIAGQTCTDERCEKNSLMLCVDSASNETCRQVVSAAGALLGASGLRVSVADVGSCATEGVNLAVSPFVSAERVAGLQPPSTDSPEGCSAAGYAALYYAGHFKSRPASRGRSLVLFLGGAAPDVVKPEVASRLLNREWDDSDATTPFKTLSKYCDIYMAAVGAGGVPEHVRSVWEPLLGAGRCFSCPTASDAVAVAVGLLQRANGASEADVLAIAKASAKDRAWAVDEAFIELGEPPARTVDEAQPPAEKADVPNEDADTKAEEAVPMQIDEAPSQVMSTQTEEAGVPVEALVPVDSSTEPRQRVEIKARATWAANRYSTQTSQSSEPRQSETEKASQTDAVEESEQPSIQELAAQCALPNDTPQSVAQAPEVVAETREKTPVNAGRRTVGTQSRTAATPFTRVQRARRLLQARRRLRQSTPPPAPVRVLATAQKYQMMMSKRKRQNSSSGPEQIVVGQVPIPRSPSGEPTTVEGTVASPPPRVPGGFFAPAFLGIAPPRKRIPRPAARSLSAGAPVVPRRQGLTKNARRRLRTPEPSQPPVAPMRSVSQPAPTIAESPQEEKKAAPKRRVRRAGSRPTRAARRKPEVVQEQEVQLQQQQQLQQRHAHEHRVFPQEHQPLSGPTTDGDQSTVHRPIGFDATRRSPLPPPRFSSLGGAPAPAPVPVRRVQPIARPRPVRRGLSESSAESSPAQPVFRAVVSEPRSLSTPPAPAVLKKPIQGRLLALPGSKPKAQPKQKPAQVQKVKKTGQKTRAEAKTRKDIAKRVANSIAAAPAPVQGRPSWIDED